MHVGQVGWSLTTLPLRGQDPTFQIHSTSFSGDSHLCVQADFQESGVASILHEGLQLPSIDNLVSIVRTHRKRKDRTLSGLLYFQLCQYGLETDEDIGNHLVPMLVTCGNLSTAQQIFQKIPYQGEHAWTSLLQGYVEYGVSHLAFQAFQKMQARNVHPTTHTFVALIKASEDLRDVKRGQELHAAVVERGGGGLGLFRGDAL
ncbi:hypothetical protein GOP47_0005392 [Adiantum capillus-veneris]|uniref:Pentatricopeptide repeat-containing protein n=1 Tax=Adiantum capillus-veneris TaxID=13818 RepID=A0A9D4ZLC1_ADICA|nr:hypothetical protein GOP47_0005392 [Adiantum capillus-veneris]